MKLSDFFQSFNILNISLFSIFLLSMDIIGYKISKKLNVNSDFRSVYWLVGSAFFAFLWFVLHFFVPFTPNYIWPSLVLSVFSFSIIEKKYSLYDLTNILPETLSLAIFFIPFSKLMFYITSMPPMHWDQMAYHYYSPYRLFAETSWNFGGNYMMFPRTIDNLFILIFSITKTYATSQLFHVLLFLSTIILVSTYLRKKSGLLSVFIFQFLMLFLNNELLFQTTWGYVDVATASLGIISLIALMRFIDNQEFNDFKTAVLFSSIAIGAKYTITSFLASIWFIAIFYFFLKNRKKIKTYVEDFKKNKSTYLFKSMWLFIIASIGGGYWYIKNLVMTGNPTYPFSFLCRSCSGGDSIIKGWGYLSFNLQNLYKILISVFKSNEMILYVACFLIIFSFFKARKEIKKIILFVFFGFLLEYALLSRVGEYHSRFFHHWPIMGSIILALQFNFKTIFKKERLLLIPLILSVFFVVQQFKALSPIDEKMAPITDNDIWFTKGKITIHDWLKLRNSYMYQIINECGGQNDFKEIYTADPDMIWGNHGLTRVYLVNCEYR